MIRKMFSKVDQFAAMGAAHLMADKTLVRSAKIAGVAATLLAAPLAHAGFISDVMSTPVTRTIFAAGFGLLALIVLFVKVIMPLINGNSDGIAAAVIGAAILAGIALKGPEIIMAIGLD
nr:hypothetical protein BdHM001_35810 [Bdellovibrio sp. HM001]